VGRAAGGHVSGEVTGGYGVDGRPADAGFGIRVLGVETTGPHEAVLTAGGVGADRAGLHFRGAGEAVLGSVRFHLAQHLESALTGGYITKINLLCLLFFYNRNWFLFISHVAPLFPFVGRFVLPKKSCSEFPARVTSF
jgi:hypothetical protein